MNLKRHGAGGREEPRTYKTGSRQGANLFCRSAALPARQRMSFQFTIASSRGVARRLIVCRGRSKSPNRAVRRNIGRFSGDFMFELTADEFESLRSHFCASSLRSQTVTSRSSRIFAGKRRVSVLNARTKP